MGFKGFWTARSRVRLDWSTGNPQSAYKLFFLPFVTRLLNNFQFIFYGFPFLHIIWWRLFTYSWGRILKLSCKIFQGNLTKIGKIFCHLLPLKCVIVSTFLFLSIQKTFSKWTLFIWNKGENLCKHNSSLQMSVESIKCSQAMWVFPSQYKKETTLLVGKQTQNHYMCYLIVFFFQNGQAVV